MFAYMAGNIEEFGTGGASFRMPYRDFVLYAVEKSSYSRELVPLIPYIDECIASWHELSASFKDLSGRIKNMSDSERKAEYAKLSKIAQALYVREKTFYTEVKKTYSKLMRE